MSGIAGSTTERTGGGGEGGPELAIELRGGEAAGWVQFQPGTLLPVQWHGNVVADSSLVPEKRLLLAILAEAVATLQRYVLDDGRRGQRLYREAKAWVLSDDVSWPCTFRNICDAPGIDPVYVRHGVMRWSDRRRANPVEGQSMSVYLPPSRRFSHTGSQSAPRRGPERASGERIRRDAGGQVVMTAYTRRRLGA